MERKKIKSECEFIELKNNRLNYKCKECQKNALSQKMKQLEIFRLCINFAMMILKFFLLLRKGAYPYEYMNNWVKFDDTSVTSKEAFHSELNEEGISDVNYAHVQKSWEVFKIEKMGEYHHLHVQWNTLLLADVFENFRDKCIEIYELDPAHFLSAPGLAWQACLKKTGVKLELLTDYDILLMVEKSIRGGICQVIYRCAKAYNKYMSNHDKRKIISYLMYLDANNLYG